MSLETLDSNYVNNIESNINTVECPHCYLDANERLFEENAGGAVNAVYSLNCPHCGFHECNKEECDECNHTDYECTRGFEEAFSVITKLEAMVSNDANTFLVNASDVTALKLELIDNDCAGWFTIIKCIGPRLPINQLKHELLDAKFNFNLERRIRHAMVN